MKKTKTLANLDNVDFNKKGIRIESPRSKLALEELGLDENKLCKLSKKEYLEKNIELKKEKSEILDKRYEHYEQKRLEALDEARQLRNEIIENDIDINNLEKNSTNECNNSNINESRCHLRKKTDIEENIIIQKELEKLELLKKQQLSEIKNLIDYEYDLNETRKKNEQKDKEKKEKEEKKKIRKIKNAKIKNKNKK